VFSKNVPTIRRIELARLFSMKVVQSYAEYLGLPTLNGRSKKQILSIICDQVWKKLNGWKEKALSRIGRESTKIKRNQEKSRRTIHGS